MAESGIYGGKRPAPNRRGHTARRDNHASYKVAKKVLEFEYQEEVPRSRLRAAYGDGFKGAPLRCQSSGEGVFPQDAGIGDGAANQALAALAQEVPCSGGSRHV